MPASSESITLSGDLHARPAGALAVAAGRFASAVSVTAAAGGDVKAVAAAAEEARHVRKL